MKGLWRALYFLIILIFYSGLAAQDYSTSVGRFLLLSGGARAGAMGGAYSAVAEDASTINWNPGGLAFIKGYEISFMHMMYDEDILYENASATLPLDFGTFGLNFIYMGMSPLAEMANGDLTGKELDYSDMAISLSFGREFFNMVGIGANVKYIKSSMGISDTADYFTGQGIAFDIGLLSRFDLFRFYNKIEKNLRVGISLQNIGTGLKYITSTHSFPTVIKPGLFYKPIKYAEVVFDYNIISDSPNTINIGLEALPEWILSPRAGIKIKDSIKTFTLGGGLKYGFGSFFFQLDYAYNTDDYFKNHMISIAIRKFTASLAEFGFGNIIIKDVFPAMYKYYTKNSVSDVEVKNDTNIPIEKIKVSMLVNKYMDFPSESKEVERLPSGDTIVVKLPAEFNNEILNISEDTPMQAQIKIDYVAEGKRHQISQTKSFKLFNRYAMTWDNFDKLAAFVTPKDPPVKVFARGMVQQYSTIRIKDLPRSIVQASVIFNALGAVGITYVLDPQSPYRQRQKATEIIDQIQYPRDTLRYKTGDCDDCSALYCALLENIGLNTAFIDIQDHIFMMFDTQVPEENALEEFGKRDLYVIKDGTAWLPIETTMFKKGFSDAWITAANEYLEASEKGIVTIVDVKKAWETFYPVTLPDIQWEPPFPSKSSMELFLNKDRRRFGSLGVKGLINELRIQLARNPRDVDILNRLAVTYGRIGKVKISQRYLEMILEQKPNKAKYFNNLANTYFLDNKLNEALIYYKQAIKLEPDNPNYRINISNLYSVMGEKDRAEEEMKKAEKLLEE
ncbi:MAG: PorV/PorQ family protein [Spirochaetes bacterium]|nr:PorV/PorQ family protein [Spirochaetota bacterium]